MATILKPAQGGRPIIIDKPIVLIGRHTDCDVTIETSGKISRKHCCLAVSGNRLMIRDLDSTNGVFVNGRRIETTADLRPGDEVVIGDVVFEVARTSSGSSRPAPVLDSVDRPTPAPESYSEISSVSRESGTLRLSGSDDLNRVSEASAHGAVEFTDSFDLGSRANYEDDEHMVRLSDSD